MAKKFLSREEYLDKQRQAIIEQSLENSNNRITPAVPYILKLTEQQWLENINNSINSVKMALDEAIKYNHGKEKINEYKKLLSQYDNELKTGHKPELCAGESCIYTATDNYGKKYRVSGNQSFRANPANYGFEEINLNDIKPGDIIQDFGFNNNTPRHAITFIGYDDDNKALFNYSKGGSTKEDIVKNGYYPFMLDDELPRAHLDGINNSKLQHAAAAYRFIGTEDDNKLWNENYNKERSDWSKQVVEELRKVPTLTLPNQVTSMKRLGGKHNNNENILNIIERFIKTKAMAIAQGISENNFRFHTIGSDIVNNKHERVGEASYLYNKKDFEDAYSNSGYIKGKEGDYGLVKEAVGNRNLPIFQKNIDDATRDNLIVLGNPKEDYIPYNKRLYDAGDYPTAMYIDNDGNVYQKAWDLNDYGKDSKGHSGDRRYNYIKQKAANFLDRIGNPHVVTTGFVKLNDGGLKYFLNNEREDINIQRKILQHKNNKNMALEYLNHLDTLYGNDNKHINKRLYELLNDKIDKKEMGGMKQDKVFKLKGGVAIPLDDKKRLFYLSGAKHEQGGIDVTPELEAEGGEVVKINPKSIKVVTAQKIMGGKSPAELVVDASSTGKSEKVFNKVFDYQENFKDRHNLNDDGTKKAKFGILEKIKNSKVGKQILDHLKFETFFDNETYDSNIIPMDNKITNGEYELYPIAEYSPYDKGHFYKKDNKVVYDDNWDYDRGPGYMQYKGYEPLNYDELRKMLPKRDYIGGNKRDVGIKVINKVPGLKNEILRLSEVYGISPNVFTQRLINEGWVQDQASFYNRSSVEEQKNYNWDRMNYFVDGFNTLGLDTFGDHHKAGHLNLRRDIKYDNNFTTNEDGTGRVYNSADFDNMYDALEAKAAMIEYLTKLGKNKGHSGSDLDAWVNAAYNMGEYHEDLKNMDYVRRKYNVKSYYKYGGQMKNKKKAFLGINDGKLPKIELKPTLIGKAVQQTPNNSLAIPSETTKLRNTNKLGLTPFDMINAGVNTLGTLLNFGHALGNAETPALIHSDYIPYTPSKLNTKININDAENKIRRSTDEIIDSINKNTADSSVARNAIRNAKLRERDTLLDLYVNKEKTENELINKDILNQQSARFKTIADANTITRENEKNKYLAKLQTQENVDNAVSGFAQNLAGITTNIANTLEQRNQFDKNLKVLGLTYPNLDVNRLNEVIYGDNTKSTKTKLSKEERRIQKERERILYNTRKNKIKMIRKGLIKPEDI